MQVDEAIRTLSKGLAGTTQAAQTTHKVSIVLSAMVAALVDAHPDKDSLHASFQRAWIAVGGPKFAVQDMRTGDSTLAAVLTLFSHAIGKELP